MPVEVSLLETQVRKPDGNWLGGKIIGMFDDISVDLSKELIKSMGFAEEKDLALVAKSGDYNDLTNSPKAYVKPTSGIPETDLSKAVRDKLNSGGSGDGETVYVRDSDDALAEAIINSNFSKIYSRTFEQGSIDPETGEKNADSDSSSIRTKVPYGYMVPVTLACAKGFVMRLYIYGDAKTLGSSTSSPYSGEYSEWSRVITHPAGKYCKFEVKHDSGTITPEDFKDKLYRYYEEKVVSSDTINVDTIRKDIADEIREDIADEIREELTDEFSKDIADEVRADMLIDLKTTKIQNRTFLQGSVNPDTGEVDSEDSTSIHTYNYAYMSSVTYACDKDYIMRLYIYGDATEEGSNSESPYSKNYTEWSRYLIQPAGKYCRIEVKRADGAEITKEDFIDKLYRDYSITSVNGQTGDVVLNGQQSLVDDIRYYDGEMAGWHMTRYQDRLYRSEKNIKMSGTGTFWNYVDTNGLFKIASKKKQYLTEFPIGEIQSFSAVAEQGLIIGVNAEKDPDYNGGIISFDLLCLGGNIPKDSDGTKLDFNVMTNFAATRATIGKTDSSINNGDYGERAAAIAKSYYDEDYKHRIANDTGLMVYGKNWSYSTTHPSIVNSNGRMPMVCSTLVLMVMLGLPFELSPYNYENYKGKRIEPAEDVESSSNDTNKGVYKFFKKDDKGNYVTDTNGNKIIDCIALRRREIYRYFDTNYWHINWFNYSDGAFQNYIAPYSSHGAISYASDETWDFWRRGWLFTARNDEGKFDPSKVADGDIVFFRSPEGNWREFTSNYDNVGHVGVCAWKDGKLVIYHVTSSSKIHDPEVTKILGAAEEKRELTVHCTPWDDYMRYIPAYATDRNDFYFGRPDYKNLVGNKDDKK